MRDWKGAIWIRLRVHVFIISFARTEQELHFEIIDCVATGLVTRYMSGILVAHPNLQAGEGGGQCWGRRQSSRSWAKERARCYKKKFRPFGPQFGLKIEGGGKGGLGGEEGGWVPGSAATFRWSATQAIWDYFLWKFCLIEARIAFYIVYE